LSVPRENVASSRKENAMAAMPLPDEEADSIHLLTIAEYAALGEIEHGYTELVEGRLLMSPSPAFRHGRAMRRLYAQLLAQNPAGLEVVLEQDVDLELAPANEPGSSRRPDILITRLEVGDQLTADGGVLVPAPEVLLAVEIVSPSSKRIDHVHKRADYADAGIPTYWIIDVDDPIALTACRLVENFGYVEDQTATGVFRADVPFPVEINLGQLV
jgi:Uma2 family endonuclease